MIAMSHDLLALALCHEPVTELPQLLRARLDFTEILFLLVFVVGPLLTKIFESKEKQATRSSRQRGSGGGRPGPTRVPPSIEHEPAREPVSTEAFDEGPSWDDLMAGRVPAPEPVPVPVPEPVPEVPVSRAPAVAALPGKVDWGSRELAGDLVPDEVLSEVEEDRVEELGGVVSQEELVHFGRLREYSDSEAPLAPTSRGTLDAIDAEAEPVRRGRGRAGFGDQDWKRAVLVSEVLGSPLALRDGGLADPFNR